MLVSGFVQDMWKTQKVMAYTLFYSLLHMTVVFRYMPTTWHGPDWVGKKALELAMQFVSVVQDD